MDGWVSGWMDGWMGSQYSPISVGKMSELLMFDSIQSISKDMY